MHIEAMIISTFWVPFNTTIVIVIISKYHDDNHVKNYIKKNTIRRYSDKFCPTKWCAQKLWVELYDFLKIESCRNIFQKKKSFRSLSN